MTVSRDVLTTLRYWMPGSELAAELVTSDEQIEAAYNGLADAMDMGLLSHDARADRYRPTNKGLDVLAQEGLA